MEKYEKEKEDWNDDILDLAVWFDKNEIPKTIRIDKARVINDLPKFIDRSIIMLELQNGNPTFKIYLESLRKIKEAIINETK